MMDTTPDAFDDHDGEILVGRIIDGEASEQDLERFEQLAAIQPTLWRELAMRQRDMTLLAERVVTETMRADEVELPAIAPRHAGRSRPGWFVAAVGWAALFVVAAAWWSLGTRPATDGMGEPRGIPASTTLSPEEHLQRYLEADYVTGTMPAVLLEVQQLSDGRLAFHYLRRIEEHAFVEPDVDVPVDASGELDPDALRGLEPEVVFPAGPDT